MRPALLLAPLLLLAAPLSAHDSGAAAPLPPGSNEMLRVPLAGHPDLEVIISDVIIPPNATVPRHYHPGQEFLYLIEGAAVHVEEEKADLPMKAGNSYAIPPRAIHSPRGGPQGARAIVFRVHQKDQPERVPAPE
jgi:quercetin dioxygenase-like cupin family protein